MKYLAYNLIIAGICALIYGLTMDTSVNGIHNLSLSHASTNIIIFGGFLFVGGIGLLAIYKSNRSEKEKSKERAAWKNFKDKYKSEDGQLIIGAILFKLLNISSYIVLIYILYARFLKPEYFNPSSFWLVIVNVIIIYATKYGEQRFTTKT